MWNAGPALRFDKKRHSLPERFRGRVFAGAGKKLTGRVDGQKRGRGIDRLVSGYCAVAFRESSISESCRTRMTGAILRNGLSTPLVSGKEYFCVRKNVILIDFESVQPESIEMLFAEHFYVYVFVGANQQKVPFAIVKSIHRMGPRADYIKIAGNGPNALDFHIAYYIGKLSNEEPPPFFHIISKDKGFDPLIQHLKSKKIYSARSETIEEISIVKNGLKKSATERAELYIAKLSEPKVTRPRTEVTLARSIKAHFRDAIEESEIPAIIASMQQAGFLKIADKKVVYSQATG